MKTTRRELKSVHSAQKQFYGKAFVIEEVDDLGISGRQVLESYGTMVCVIEFGHVLKVTINGEGLSKTSRRHLREFIIQNLGAKFWHEVSVGMAGKKWVYTC